MSLDIFKKYEILFSDMEQEFRENLIKSNSIGSYIDFAVWIQENHYIKKVKAHPNNIGKWWSDYVDTDYLTDTEILIEFLKR